MKKRLEDSLGIETTKDDGTMTDRKVWILKFKPVLMLGMILAGFWISLIVAVTLASGRGVVVAAIGFLGAVIAEVYLFLHAQRRYGDLPLLIVGIAGFVGTAALVAWSGDWSVGFRPIREM